MTNEELLAKLGIAVNEENQVSDGLKMEFPFQVTEAYFTVDANYQSGNVPLLKLVGLDLDDETEHTELWSIGNNWEITEAGETVIPTKGQKGFNSSSTIGMVIKGIRENRYGEQCMMDLLPKSLRRASSWVGTCWNMGGVEIETMDKDEKGNRVKKIKRLPVEYAGGGGKVTAQTQQASQASQSVKPNDVAALLAAHQAQSMQATPPVNPVSQANNPVNQFEPKYILKLDKAKIKAFVDRAKDFTPEQNATFIAAAASIDPTIFQNTELQAAVMSGELLKELKAMGA